jgi:tetratricopeptide (TPR) repeat protein
MELARQALDLFPNQPRIHFYLAEAAATLQIYDEGLEAINMGRLMARKDGYLLYHLAILEGFIHAELGDQAKAGLAFDTALQLNPRGPEALAMRSLSQSDPRMKCRFAEEAAAVDARMTVVRFALAHCAFFNADYALSKSTLLPLVEKPYPHPAWLELLGDTYAMMGDKDNALLLWEKTDKTGAGSARLKEKLNKRQYIE